jgi:HD-GYP domain-containing protein (c-di-GMP phosphodiesterase class II)
MSETPSPDSHTETLVPILNSLQALGEAADLIHPQLARHHELTGFIAASISASMGASAKEQETLLFAGLAHDVGAFSITHRLHVARFDSEETFPHCLAGYALLSDFPSFRHLADLVRCHHVRWDKGSGSRLDEDTTPKGAYILHLADRVAVAIVDKKGDPQTIGKQVVSQVRSQSGKMFDPDLVDVFLSMSERENFWEKVATSGKEPLTDSFQTEDLTGSKAPVSELACFFSRVIDFRSPFTAAHSKSVSVVAERLGRLAGLSKEESGLLNVAGHLHDLGKMGVSTAIIEKAGELTEPEFEVMKSHPDHTFYVLRKTPELDRIRRWCRNHHERLDGSGYPNRLKGSDICLHSRILTAADLFVALTEDRPYRKAMPLRDAMAMVEKLAENGKLDRDVTALTRKHSEDVYARMMAAKGAERENYKAFLDSSFFPAFR